MTTAAPGATGARGDRRPAPRGGLLAGPLPTLVPGLAGTMMVSG